MVSWPRVKDENFGIKQDLVYVTAVTGLQRWRSFRALAFSSTCLISNFRLEKKGKKPLDKKSQWLQQQLFRNNVFQVNCYLNCRNDSKWRMILAVPSAIALGGLKISGLQLWSITARIILNFTISLATLLSWEPGRVSPVGSENIILVPRTFLPPLLRKSSGNMRLWQDSKGPKHSTF